MNEEGSRKFLFESTYILQVFWFSSIFFFFCVRTLIEYCITVALIPIWMYTNVVLYLLQCALVHYCITIALIPYVLSVWPQRNVWPSAPFYYQKIDKNEKSGVVVKWCRRSKNENYAKKRAELFHPQFLVLRLQTKYKALHKKRPQSVKLKSSQSDNDRPRNNSGKGCHQTDTLLGKMKITQKRGRNCFTPSF